MLSQFEHQSQPKRILDQLVSVFRGAKATAVAETVPLGDILHRIQDGTYRATIATLQERLQRYQQIGLRQWQQPPAQALYGTHVWFENVILRRALQQREATIDQLQRVISALKLLRPDRASLTTPPEVHP